MFKKAISVGCFFYDKKAKTVFLHRRDHKAPQGKNTWDYFGGAVEKKDKTTLDALVREISEELGITLKKRNYKLLCSKNEKNIYVIFTSMSKFQPKKIGEGAGYTWLLLDYVINNRLRDLSGDALEQLKKIANGKN